jgi:hypothetical protein
MQTRPRRKADGAWGGRVDERVYIADAVKGQFFIFGNPIERKSDFDQFTPPDDMTLQCGGKRFPTRQTASMVICQPDAFDGVN